MIRTNRELYDYIARLVDEGSARSFSIHHYHSRDHILEEGKQVYAVYIIKTGIAKCFLSTDNGNLFIQEFFGEGELFGELELMEYTVSYCTIQAVNDMVVYKISRKDFLELLLSDQQFNQLFIRALITKLSYKATRHAYNQSHTIEDKLLRLRTSFPELEEVIPKKDIADYLGITLRALNRTIKSLS